MWVFGYLFAFSFFESRFIWINFQSRVGFAAATMRSFLRSFIRGSLALRFSPRFFSRLFLCSRWLSSQRRDKLLRETVLSWDVERPKPVCSLALFEAQTRGFIACLINDVVVARSRLKEEKKKILYTEKRVFAYLCNFRKMFLHDLLLDAKKRKKDLQKQNKARA